MAREYTEDLNATHYCPQCHIPLNPPYRDKETGELVHECRFCHREWVVRSENERKK